MVPRFIQQFQPPFPVGFNNFATAQEFMQHPPMLILHMPVLLFIDRQGRIVAQYEGDAPFMERRRQEQNIRGEIEKLLPARERAEDGAEVGVSRTGHATARYSWSRTRSSSSAVRDAALRHARRCRRRGRRLSVERRFQRLAGVDAGIGRDRQQHRWRVGQRGHEDGFGLRREALRQRAQFFQAAGFEAPARRGGSHPAAGGVAS